MGHGHLVVALPDTALESPEDLTDAFHPVRAQLGGTQRSHAGCTDHPHTTAEREQDLLVHDGRHRVEQPVDQHHGGWPTVEHRPGDVAALRRPQKLSARQRPSCLGQRQGRPDKHHDTAHNELRKGDTVIPATHRQDLSPQNCQPSPLMEHSMTSTTPLYGQLPSMCHATSNAVSGLAKSWRSSSRTVSSTTLMILFPYTQLNQCDTGCITLIKLRLQSRLRQ